MTAVMSNVIKISNSGTPLVNSTTFVATEYPKVCDFCRDTYDSEHTYNQHKETGECYRFCKLREVERRKVAKIPKISIYPRVCDVCSKVYKNKHSYYKHKTRCNGINVNEASNEPISDSPMLPASIVDVVEVAENDIENVPIIDNKENIDDFDSNFILTLDVAVDEDFDASDSLYPRICEICHKVFKTHESFESHKIRTKCSGIKANLPVGGLFRRCDNCKKLILKKMHDRHVKRCDKFNLETFPVLKKVDKVERSEVESSKEFPFKKFCHGCETHFTSKILFYQHSCAGKTPKQSIYPRTCEKCGFVFQTKFTFHRHKRRCKLQSNSGDEDDSYFSCSICSRPFDTISVYLQHLKEAHPIEKVDEMPHKRRHMYPRKCSKCFIVYATRQTFCNHKKRCAATTNLDIIDLADAPEPEESVEKISYPRTCCDCQHTYLNRQSFWNHKKLCQNFIATKKDQKLYPRRCEFCLKVYSTKQTYHHHKSRCRGEKKTFGSLYPRTCNHCNRTYAVKQSYRNHLITCPGGQKTLAIEEEIVNGDDNLDQDQSDTDYEPEVKRQCTIRTVLYPRMCEGCRKIYANRITFNKHKPRCVSASRPLNDTVEDYDTSLPLPLPSPEPDPITYPRECENCFGTFQSEVTFNAHKVRCDFFDASVRESQFKKYYKSKCEHCRNIVSQFRRIYHQHLEQCSDPIIAKADTLSVVESATAENPPEHNEVTSSSSEEANFCDCCGIFFKTRTLIEQHKKNLLRSTKNFSLFQCDICTEEFDSQEELSDHKSRCVLNVSNRTYPRFCECCKKIYKSKQTFYNHKKNCHVHCLKYFVLKDCENCKLPFKCEKVYDNHVRMCVKIGDEAVAVNSELSDEPAAADKT